ncbi:hypothetical protein CEXT_649511 [Caerostris extrusa]|uniref:Uncharacterized protein n=1 Tax=Caerostris extrusa TaxID=172846 RepID=A0AAV4WA89_CAEEX|nr:hypothetical protein CEXT_649511 [Caerostris extrusa]
MDLKAAKRFTHIVFSSSHPAKVKFVQAVKVRWLLVNLEIVPPSRGSSVFLCLETEWIARNGEDGKPGYQDPAPGWRLRPNPGGNDRVLATRCLQINILSTETKLESMDIHWMANWKIKRHCSTRNAL